MLRTLLLASTLLAAPALAQTAPGRQQLPATPAQGQTAPMGTAEPQGSTPITPDGQTAPSTEGTTPFDPNTVEGQAAPAAPAAAAAPATTTVAQALPTLPNRATLNRLVTAAGLGTDLAGAGPFTVFAPSDEAFGRMPAGAIDTLLKPENKAVLGTVLKYHVVAGKLTAEQLKAQITAGNGSTTLTTLAGQTLTASLGQNGNVMLTDVNGVKAYVEQADLAQTNGVVHLTNGVVVPKLG